MDSEKNYIIVIEWLWEYKPQGKMNCGEMFSREIR